MPTPDRPLAEAAASALLRAINVIGGNPWVTQDPLLDFVFKELTATRSEPQYACLMAAEVAVHRYQRNWQKPPQRPEIEDFLSGLTDLCRSYGATAHWTEMTVAMRGWSFDVSVQDGVCRVDRELYVGLDDRRDAGTE